MSNLEGMGIDSITPSLINAIVIAGDNLDRDTLLTLTGADPESIPEFEPSDIVPNVVSQINITNPYEPESTEESTPESTPESTESTPESTCTPINDTSASWSKTITLDDINQTIVYNGNDFNVTTPSVTDSDGVGYQRYSIDSGGSTDYTDSQITISGLSAGSHTITFSGAGTDGKNSCGSSGTVNLANQSITFEVRNTTSDVFD